MFLCLQARPSFHDILEFWPNRGKEQGDTGVIMTIKGVLGNIDNQGRHWVIKGTRVIKTIQGDTGVLTTLTSRQAGKEIKLLSVFLSSTIYLS